MALCMADGSNNRPCATFLKLNHKIRHRCLDIESSVVFLWKQAILIDFAK